MSGVPVETPEGNALASMGNGERCAVNSVLECPKCETVYEDHEEDYPGECGLCDHIARWTYTGRAFLRRRARRPDDMIVLSYRF